ncbi:MAG: ribosomal RNA small subunit methyltransferase A [Deltaproteobacteria bacterium]|nr:ribosomal RNA small subunit methyltransferase A [Deltaproteobacteria bacterium]
MNARSDVRSRLARYGLRARKSFGQHFLIADDVLETIAQAAVDNHEQSVIEVGAGLGTLTERLADRAKKVVAIEHDRDLIPLLQEELKARANITLIEADALAVDFTSLLPANPKPRLAGNLPYNISTPLLFRFLEHREHLDTVTIMIQREVALRLSAEPNTKDYGVLSLLFGLHAQVEFVTDVPPASFAPPPKVDSSVIQLVWREAPAIEVGREEVFTQVVKAAFGLRRKTLRNALSAKYPKAIVGRAEEISGISFTRRAESLSLHEFGMLTRAFLDATQSDEPA